MIVCVCHRVSDRAIAAAAQDGCRSFEQLQAELGVGTRCGACRTCARETFERHASGRRSACGSVAHPPIANVLVTAVT
jgi:bacterioferritin-associated ferredoxin